MLNEVWRYVLIHSWHRGVFQFGQYEVDRDYAEGHMLIAITQRGICSGLPSVESFLYEVLDLMRVLYVLVSRLHWVFLSHAAVHPGPQGTTIVKDDVGKPQPKTQM